MVYLGLLFYSMFTLKKRTNSPVNSSGRRALAGAVCVHTPLHKRRGSDSANERGRRMSDPHRLHARLGGLSRERAQLAPFCEGDGECRAGDGGRWHVLTPMHKRHETLQDDAGVDEGLQAKPRAMPTCRIKVSNFVECAFSSLLR